MGILTPPSIKESEVIMFKSRLSLKDNVTIRVFNAKGEQVKIFVPNLLGRLTGWRIGKMVNELCSSNLIVNTALSAIGSASFDTNSNLKFSYIAVGSSLTPAKVTDEGLVDELSGNGMDRKVGVPTKDTTDVTNDTQVLTAVFTATGSHQTIGETGIFSAVSGGVMYNRHVLRSPLVLEPDFSVQIQHSVQFKGEA